MNFDDTNEQRLLRVLIVDDERMALRSLSGILQSLGNIELHRASNLAEARQILEEAVLDIAFIDLQLSQDIRNRDGFTLVQEIRGRYQTVPVVVSSHSQPNEIREAMKLGAEDYVLKTEIDQRVPIIIKELRHKLELNQELLDLRARGAPDSNLGLIGTSVAMQNLRALLQRVATADLQEPVPVLILGPTGSGKELVAQGIHKLGPHPSEPFFDINCGALAETLVEDQLFGHVRGAFTDATRDQDGYFTLVRRGTLFLDEVAELTPALQARLLRVLETRRFRPVGPTAREQFFQGRIVAATHVDLQERVRKGQFREDLFHRLNVLLIRVPPLSGHREDIPALVQHFVAGHRKPLHFTQEAIEQLCRRPWPGNIRELRNAIYRLAILADSERIDAEMLERYLPLESNGAPGDVLEELLSHMARQLLSLPLPGQDRSHVITKALVLEAMEQARDNKTEAGKKLGWNRKAVERFLKNLDDSESGEDEDKGEPVV
ncbi:sigma-54 dependent transcriptional regulator [Vitiosangium sp. GDMCC 1.1324]|uniref:sigma-54-dependent transcriptional regulator n=1 Tax=Vitiosangium sp. (strain GDMCC 1.1324) TaxID=2138576 RepID=UPI000D3787CC|nr:sigma-54 dependent transcriptional regulator [Vitiosangium sp. GDMCC 1.1324]PTL82499.1 sigma-54-dependent Fis family transcriptional regulator [Vitiosangium sp. GDMCC 1.1324]